VCRWIGDLLSLGQSGSPFEKRGCLSMSAVRYHDGTAAVGQEETVEKAAESSH